jgi:hypothetical protein
LSAATGKLSARIQQLKGSGRRLSPALSNQYGNPSTIIRHDSESPPLRQT